MIKENISKFCKICVFYQEKFMMKTQLMIDLLFKIFWNFLILICTDQKLKNYEKCQKPYKRI